MKRTLLAATVTVSLVVLLAPAGASAQTAASLSWSGAHAPSAAGVFATGPLAAAALRESSRFHVQAGTAAGQRQNAPHRSWVRRHPIWFSFLVGAAVGAALGGADPGPENRAAAMFEGAILIGGMAALPVAMVVGIREEDAARAAGKAEEAKK